MKLIVYLETLELQLMLNMLSHLPYNPPASSNPNTFSAPVSMDRGKSQNPTSWNSDASTFSDTSLAPVLWAALLSSSLSELDFTFHL